MYPNHTTNEDECHSWHRHHTVVHIAEVVAGIGDNLEAQQRTATEQFTDSTHNHQNHGIAKAVAHTVEERRPGLVLHGEGLEATHEDTVGNDQTYIHAQLNAHVISESLQDLRNDGNKSRHDHQLHHDTDAVRNGVADNRDNHIREGGNDRHSESHHDGRLQLRSDGECRADTQYLSESRFNGLVKTSLFCLLNNAIVIPP